MTRRRGRMPVQDRLLGFLFTGIFLAVGYNWLLDRVHAYFSQSLWLQRNWIGPYIAAPVLLLAALALTFGFFRRGSTLLGNALAILIIAALVYLTLGAGYSCWKWCF